MLLLQEDHFCCPGSDTAFTALGIPSIGGSCTSIWKQSNLNWDKKARNRIKRDKKAWSRYGCSGSWLCQPQTSATRSLGIATIYWTPTMCLPTYFHLILKTTPWSRLYCPKFTGKENEIHGDQTNSYKGFRGSALPGSKSLSIGHHPKLPHPLSLSDLRFCKAKPSSYLSKQCWLEDKSEELFMVSRYRVCVTYTQTFGF